MNLFLFFSLSCTGAKPISMCAMMNYDAYVYTHISCIGVFVCVCVFVCVRICVCQGFPLYVFKNINMCVCLFHMMFANIDMLLPFLCVCVLV